MKFLVKFRIIEINIHIVLQIMILLLFLDIGLDTYKFLKHRVCPWESLWGRFGNFKGLVGTLLANHKHQGMTLIDNLIGVISFLFLNSNKMNLLFHPRIDQKMGHLIILLAKHIIFAQILDIDRATEFRILTLYLHKLIKRRARPVKP